MKNIYNIHDISSLLQDDVFNPWLKSKIIGVKSLNQRDQPKEQI